MIKISTFCSGIGAAEQAFKNLDIPHEVVFACEIDKYARMSYEANHSAETMYEDMTQHDYVDAKYYSDINISGIPCQAFSLAGLRKGENDSRGLLFYDFYRYVKNQQPKIFIIENVKGLLSDAGGKTFSNWLQLLGRSVNTQENMFNHPDSLGYNLHWTVLNSKNFGVPQNRERVFLVGIRNDLPNTFSFPKGWKLTVRLKDILEPVVDEKYYLSEKMVETLIRHGNKISKEETPNVSACIHAGYYKMGGRDQQYLKVKEATKQGFAIAEPGDSINISNPNSLTRRGRVGKGIANTLETSCNQVVVEPFCVAMRGRNLENKNDRTAGANLKQTLEINSQGTTNCLSTVQKDNLIVEPQVINPLKDKTEFGWHFEQNVFDVKGITRALKSSEGSGNKMKIIEPQLNQIAQLDGFESEGRIYDANGIARTIKDGGGGGQSPVKHLTKDARIRRLTPLEVFRLQAFPDDFFYKCKAVNSDSQLYKQAGNSITVNVMREIINNLIHILG